MNATARSTGEDGSVPAAQRAARDVAADRVRRLASRFPDLPLEIAESDGDALDGRDAALARAIEQAVIRHWLAIEAIVQSRIDRPWDRVQTAVRAALLTGAAQVFFFDRLPVHAATDHAVEWTKRRLNARAGGFVNAIMRRIIDLRADHVEMPADFALSQRDLPRGDGTMWRLKEDVFAERAIERVAQQTSHPDLLVRSWTDQYGYEQARRIALHNLVHPPIIIAGAQQEFSDPCLRPHERPGFAVFDGAIHELAPLLAAHPTLRVQDPASAAAIELTGGRPFRRIADLCAGRGTKTAQLALMHPDAEIVAGDPDAARAQILRRSFVAHPSVSVIDSTGWSGFAQAFDLVVLDVPCSNTGVLARRLEAKYRFSEKSLGDVVKLQRRIIAEGLRLRAPDGYILYSTCSLEKMENRRQVDEVLRWHPLRIEDDRLTLPTGLPGEPATAFSDGGYAVLLGPS